MKKAIPVQVGSISALHQQLNLPAPTHPLVSLIDLQVVQPTTRLPYVAPATSYPFYVISFKKNFGGKLKYGHQYYDFSEGVMSFMAPHQVVSLDEVSSTTVEGYVLLVHPDFIRSYPIARLIKSYGFFAYSTAEALHLSAQEEDIMLTLFDYIGREINQLVDLFQQDIIVSHLTSLLAYVSRFYRRQFITRKQADDSLLLKVDQVLERYFDQALLAEHGLPSVQQLAGELHLSPNYLSDMLRVLTGQSARLHIQYRLVEKAKELLSVSSLSVSEIAYALGFEHPQSFHRFFKSKTKVSPLTFRLSFN